MSAVTKYFELFGLIGDASSRRNLAEVILQRVTGKLLASETKPNAGNFSLAIDEILSDETMKELCAADQELAEKVTSDILEFINGTSKTVARTESPFDEERKLLDTFRSATEQSFEQEWSKVTESIKAHYPRRSIDCDFHMKEFRKSLRHVEQSSKNGHSFTIVKEHFLEKWESQLFQKESQWELQIIDEARKEFCKQLYSQMRELKELRDILEPFTDELGRFWDLSNGNWRKADLDLLRKYANLLRNNKSIQELVALLGRMRQSERALEEELYSEKVIKQEGKINHSAKSDLIGVKESDDLNSLLPSEVALLADADLEIVFLKKYAEKKLQTFEYQARYADSIESDEIKSRQKPDSKGPIIICVDTSGSMHGTPEIVAKTLCFAFTKVAIRENRKVFLISFSTDIETIDLGDMKQSLHKTLAFLSMNFNGGTDGSRPLEAALKMLVDQNYRNADVMMISDFVMNPLSQRIEESIKQAQTDKTRFHSLDIGDSANTDVLNCFDHNWHYDPSNPEAMMQLVKNLSTI